MQRECKSEIKAPQLSDEECMSFVTGNLSMKDLIRLIHEDGFYQGVVAQEDVQNEA